MVRFVNKSRPNRANQITGTASDFKMDVINSCNEIQLRKRALISPCARWGLQQTNASRRNFFLASDFEQADEDLPTFSLGMDFFNFLERTQRK